MMDGLVILAGVTFAWSVVRMLVNDSASDGNNHNFLLGSILFVLWSIAALLAAVLIELANLRAVVG